MRGAAMCQRKGRIMQHGYCVIRHGYCDGYPAMKKDQQWKLPKKSTKTFAHQVNEAHIQY